MFFEVIFDLETKNFFDDIADKNPANLGVSLVCLYARQLDESFREISGEMYAFWENDFSQMWSLFFKADRIVGFNSLHFDVPALEPYAPSGWRKLPHFDILSSIKDASGRRVSLNSVAKETLGIEKNDWGENAVRYWQAGDSASLAKLEIYCRMDVTITTQIYDFGLKNRKLYYRDFWNSIRTVEVDFSYPKDFISSGKQGSLF